MKGFRKGELPVFSASEGTGRSLVLEHAMHMRTQEPTDEQRRIADQHDLLELDIAGLEERVLAQLEQDAKAFDGMFGRDDDPECIKGIDSASFRRALEKFRQRGVVNSPDFHKILASEMFDVPEDEVTPAQRNFAKTYNYMRMYSASPEAIQKLVDRDLEKANKRLQES